MALFKGHMGERCMLKFLICATVLAMALLASAQTSGADPTGDLDRKILDIMQESAKADSADDGGKGNASTKEMVELGIRHELGRGVQFDATRAVELYTDAALQGSREAQAHLCRVYYMGIFDSKLKEVYRHDYALAHAWCEKAAKLGSAFAIHNLGDMYYQGIGVTKNKDKGLEYARMAAEKGYIEAHERLWSAYSTGNGTDIDCGKATQHLEYIIQHNPELGLYIKGVAHEQGDACTKKDILAARDFYKAACEKGHFFACESFKVISRLIEITRAR